jgi:nucleoside 2-deoxyribosyltransferase
MRSNSIVYLAGPIAGLHYAEATDWRDYAVARLGQHGIVALSPMRDKPQLQRDDIVFNSRGYDTPLTAQRGIYARDRNDVQRADVLLVNLAGAKDISIGTMFEMAWASLLQKPIVLVMRRNDANNIHEHVFVNEAAHFRVDLLDEGIDICRSIIGVPAHEGFLMPEGEGEKTCTLSTS